MLTIAAVRAVKPKAKPYKLADGAGMYLFVNHAGRYWRLDYRFAGKRKTLALGVFPAVSIAEARRRRDAARAMLAEDPPRDPAAARAQRKQDAVATAITARNTFEVVAREWYEARRETWAASHASKIIQRFERDVFPWIGSKSVDEMTPPDLLAVLRRLEARGVMETAHRALQTIGQVLRYAVATGRAQRDVSQDLRGALAPVKRGHFAAVTDPIALGDLLRAMDSHRGTAIVHAALQLAPLVFVRPGELRMMRWADVDLDACEWRFVTSKTKTQHVVPLAKQAIAILNDLKPLTGHREHVFPSERGGGRPMSDGAVTVALRSLGISRDVMTGHGFRATARTILDEVLGYRPDLIEHQLAHRVLDPLGRAYNRTSHLPQRHAMMQAWADYLDGLKAGAIVLPFKSRAR